MKKALVLLLVLVVGLPALAYRYYMVAIDEDHSRFAHPASVAEARERGVLVAEIPVGSVRRWDGQPEDSVAEAWVHAESHAEWFLLAKRRVVLEDTLRLCFSIRSGAPFVDLVSRVGSTREWWLDDRTASRFSATWSPGEPIVQCRRMTEEAPEVLEVTLVNQDSLAAALPSALNSHVDSLPHEYRVVGPSVRTDRLEILPMEFSGLPVLVLVHRRSRRVVALPVSPRPAPNERLLLDRCRSQSSAEGLVVATVNVREQRVARAWRATVEPPHWQVLAENDVECARPAG